jgi:hypothetical protein
VSRTQCPRVRIIPFGALLPKEYSFFDFFEQHASKCVEGAHLLLQLLQNVQEAEALTKEVKEVEHAGDKITGAIVGVGATTKLSAVRWGVAGRIRHYRG